MKADALRCMQKSKSVLGEGPLWDAREEVLYWIDVLKPEIHRHNPATGKNNRWTMPSSAGAIGLVDHNRLIVALEHQGICIFDPKTGGVHPFCDPLAVSSAPDVPGRFNDGAVDAKGNFWVGWLTHSREQPGRLFRISPAGQVKTILADPVAPNGLGWSPDSRRFYFTDSHINTIWSYDCDPVSGTLSNRAVLARQERRLGIFDGLSVDAEGNIWTALYDGGAVVHLSPEGRELARIELPVRLVTSCAFGGPQLKQLMITTAVRDQSEADLVSQPLAGSVFSATLPCAGSCENTFPYL